MQIQKRIPSFTLCFIALCILLTGCDRKVQQLAESYLPKSVDDTHLNEITKNKIRELRHNILNKNETLSSFKELAQVFQANGMLREATSCYEGLLQMDPTSTRWPHLLATILAGYGYADDAIELWENVIERDPQYIPVRIRIGDLYLKSNQKEKAYLAYQEILKIEAKNPYAMVGLARLAIQNKNWKTAEKHLKESSSVSNGKIGKDLLVTVYEAQNKNNLAQAIRSEAKASGSFIDIIDPWVEEVMQHCYDVDQLITLGGTAAYRKDHKKAIATLQKALQIDPSKAIAHYQISYSYEQLENETNAIKHLRKTVELKEDFSDAWIRLASFYSQQGDEGESERIFYTGFDKCPTSPAYQIEHARRLTKKKKYTSAIKALQKSIELRPNEALAYIELSKCYFSLEQIDKGLEQLRKSLDVEAGNLTAMTTLCFHSIMSENKEESDRWMNALSLHPRLDAPTRNKLQKLYKNKFETNK